MESNGIICPKCGEEISSVWGEVCIKEYYEYFIKNNKIYGELMNEVEEEVVLTCPNCDYEIFDSWEEFVKKLKK